MGIEQDLRQVSLRTRRYWYYDGLAEVAAGALLLLVGLYFLAQELLTRASAPGWILPALQILVVLLALLLTQATRILKDHFVHGRTGFVSYSSQAAARRWFARLLSAVIAGGIASLLMRSPSLLPWLPALIGLLVGGALLWIGVRLEVFRFQLLAAVSASLGVLAALAGVSPDLQASIYFGGMGLAVVLAGLLAFRRYLRVTAPGGEL
jgi:hypothetical protein